jgi:hypothetical protein
VALLARWSSILVLAVPLVPVKIKSPVLVV